MKPTHPGDDLQAIRSIMERSSKFLSLSGLSGVLAGIIALTGAAVAWLFILQGQTYAEFLIDLRYGPAALLLVADAMVVLILAFSGAAIFSLRKAKKAGLPFWSPTTRRVLLHLFIPLATGGVVIALLIARRQPDLIAPAMLIFYGLALVNTGKFTFGEIHYLGLTQIVLGLLALGYTGQGLLLWALGFGVMHILYGTLMYLRHEHPANRTPK